MAIPTSELQNINPSGILDLFIIELNVLLHGKNETFRFHSGTNQLNTSIVWQGDQYDKFPIQAEGFEYSGRGSLPRPTLTISNLSSAPSISALLLSVNETTPGNDLTGAVVTRIRTLAKFLDAVNFADGTNATADPSAEFPKEIYSIDRKSSENRELVEFELASPTDLAGIRIPKRQATHKLFTAIGTFSQ